MYLHMYHITKAMHNIYNRYTNRYYKKDTSSPQCNNVVTDIFVKYIFLQFWSPIAYIYLVQECYSLALPVYVSIEPNQKSCIYREKDQVNNTDTKINIAHILCSINSSL